MEVMVIGGFVRLILTLRTPFFTSTAMAAGTPPMRTALTASLQHLESHKKINIFFFLYLFIYFNMNKFMLQIFLIILISFSLSICILYLNYFEVGYNFFEYVKHSFVYIISIIIGLFILIRLN